MKKILAVFLVLIIAVAAVGCNQNDSETAGNQGDSLDYPKRPIELVIPFGEGGASDIFGRKFAEIVSKDMPKPIQPVNKKGSGGLVGMLYAAQQKNDGYTILGITPSHVIADALEKSPEVKLMEDFEPLARIQSDIYILCVPEGSKFKTFEQLVEYGKENEVTFAGISPGGLDDMTLNALSAETGMKIKFIPYKSGSEVKAAVLGKEVDIYLDKVISAINYIRDGKVKPIVVLNQERIDKVEELKDVPATVELGYDITIGSWRGFVVKKGTPEEVKAYLIEKMQKAYESEEYQKFAEQNLVNIREGYLDAEGFRKVWDEQYKLFDEIARKVGLK